jgi:hypothetical protein
MSRVDPEQIPATPERLEHVKNVLDYLKHITTLSTGSIILQITFLEKLFVHPRWRALVAVSLVSFMLSIVASVVAHAQVIYKQHYTWEMGDAFLGCISMWIVWGGFLLGLASLTAFALVNLFNY